MMGNSKLITDAEKSQDLHGKARNHVWFMCDV